MAETGYLKPANLYYTTGTSAMQTSVQEYLNGDKVYFTNDTTTAHTFTFRFDLSSIPQNAVVTKVSIQISENASSYARRESTTLSFRLAKDLTSSGGYTSIYSDAQSVRSGGDDDWVTPTRHTYSYTGDAVAYFNENLDAVRSGATGTAFGVRLWGRAFTCYDLLINVEYTYANKTYVGDTMIKSAYVGTAPVKAIYVGTNKVY